MNIINMALKTSRHSQRALFRSLANTPPYGAEDSSAPPHDEIQKVDMIWQRKDTE